MWDRWHEGESLDAIGLVFDRPSSNPSRTICVRYPEKWLIAANYDKNFEAGMGISNFH